MGEIQNGEIKMIEMWKLTIGGYLISNFGKVKSPSRFDQSEHLRKEKEIKPYITKTGYKRVNLFIDGKRKNFFVHRLVAMAFVEGFEEGLDVNHIDGNKLNNNFQNLEWVTSGENQKHAYRTGLKKPKINGEKLSKKIRQFTRDREFLKEYPSSKEVERQTGFDRSNICRACRNNSSAYGYLWEFA